jgi:hypothetical protein
MESGAALTGVQPGRLGFGTRLIDTNIEHRLNATIERRWTPTGLTLVVCIPLEHVLPERNAV